MIEKIEEGNIVDSLLHVFDLSNGSISSEGTFAACVSRHADHEENEYRTCLHVLKVNRSPYDLKEVWSEEIQGVHTLRFSPDGTKLAFACTMEHGETVQVLKLSDWTMTVVLQDVAAIGAISWGSDSNRLFVVCDDPSLYPTSDDGVLHIHSIPTRWPWWRKRRRLLQVSLQENTPPLQLFGPVNEISSLAVSANDQIAFVEEREVWPTHTSMFLHVLDGNIGKEVHVFSLPNSYLSTPVFSSSGDRIAYIGARFAGMQQEQQIFQCPREERRALEEDGIGVNAYDTRVFVLDLETGVLRQLGYNALFCAGIPVGMAPLHQEVSWQEEDSLTYVATQGERTVLVQQKWSTPDVWTVVPLGDGSSRGHCFSANGLLFCFQSERGQPFVPSLLEPGGQLKRFQKALAVRQPVCKWHQPLILSDISACGAWIYWPNGSSPNKKSIKQGTVPVVLSVYGGASPLGKAFDDQHQLLVENGYAVLVVNPSGCGGYGAANADLHVNDWGDRAVDEIVETLEQLLDRYPELNREAIGVYGGSYGGYLSLLLLARSKLFRTGVSVAGITNIASYWGSGYFGFQYGLTALKGKTPWEDPDFFVRRSPFYLTHQIDAPILLMHGEFDTNVPLSESEQFFTALQAQGNECSLLLFPGEDHKIKSSPRVVRATRDYLCAWFNLHLKGETETWDVLTSQDVDQEFKM